MMMSHWNASRRRMSLPLHGMKFSISMANMFYARKVTVPAVFLASNTKKSSSAHSLGSRPLFIAIMCNLAEMYAGMKVPGC